MAHCVVFAGLSLPQGWVGSFTDRRGVYRRLGWLEIGTVPKHFVDPWAEFKRRSI